MSISYTMSFQGLNDNELLLVSAGGVWADVGNALITVGLGIVSIAKVAAVCTAVAAGTVTFGVVAAAVVSVGALGYHVYTTYR